MRPTTPCHVGPLTIGGTAPISVQSMTTTATDDVDASLQQTIRIIQAGADIVRLTTQGSREAHAIGSVKQALLKQGYDTPLVADVHFNPDIADIAATQCDAVRINPGNYADPARTFRQLDYTDTEYDQCLQRLAARFRQLLAICRHHHTALRIGVNHGSLSDRIMSRYGNTPEGITASAMEFLRVAAADDFRDIVVSVKASRPDVMVRATRMLAAAMDAEGMPYPLHLGVTEAGSGHDGRLKSATGIGALLTEGLGNTIRVSLTEEPEAEIPVARAIIALIPQATALRQQAEAAITGGTLTLPLPDTPHPDLLAAMAAAAPLIDRRATALVINDTQGRRLTQLEDDILQATAVRRTRTDYISCPGCGRTLYDLQATTAEIQTAINAAAADNPRLRTLTIGIMGCIVNGPGEMHGADYGYVGAGPGRITLYRGHTPVEKNIPQQQAVARLLDIINNDCAPASER